MPLSLRTRFTELFVSEPTTLEDLRLVADACLQGGGSSGGIYVLYVCLPSPYNLDAFRSLSYPAGLPSTLSLSLSLSSHSNEKIGIVNFSPSIHCNNNF